jgi:hypothetical protein
MSALGHKQTLKRFHSMSALPPKADILRRDQDVCFGPKGDKVRRSKKRRYSITSSARPSSESADGCAPWLIPDPSPTPSPTIAEQYVPDLLDGGYAASGYVKTVSNWSSAQSISSRVITSGGLTRMVWS